MKPSPWMTFLVVGVTFNLACTDDIRGTKPDRTRDADGIIKLYRNQEQGDWMLKGKVVRVDVAVVVDAPRSGLALTVAGQTSLAPVPIMLSSSADPARAAPLSWEPLLNCRLSEQPDRFVAAPRCRCVAPSTKLSYTP